MSVMKVSKANVKRWELSKISLSMIATSPLDDQRVSACAVIHWLYLDQSSSDAVSLKNPSRCPHFHQHREVDHRVEVLSLLGPGEDIPRKQ